MPKLKLLGRAEQTRNIFMYADDDYQPHFQERAQVERPYVAASWARLNANLAEAYIVYH
jgi:hypothetical protein